MNHICCFLLDSFLVRTQQIIADEINIISSICHVDVWKIWLYFAYRISFKVERNKYISTGKIPTNITLRNYEKKWLHSGLFVITHGLDFMLKFSLCKIKETTRHRMKERYRYILYTKGRKKINVCIRKSRLESSKLHKESSKLHRESSKLHRESSNIKLRSCIMADHQQRQK